MKGAVDEFGGRGRSGGQKPGFFPEHFVTAQKNRKNPVSLVGARKIAIGLSYPEDEIQRVGKPETESVVAGTRKKAVERCLEEAKGRKLLTVQHFQKNIWQCIFPGGEDED